jgi:hypothetical protein
MMRHLFTRAAGGRSLGVAAILLVLTTAGSPAAREAGRRSSRYGPGAIVPASESARFRSLEWLRLSQDERLGTVVDLELDGLIQDMGGRGGLVLDRVGLTEALRAVLGEDVAVADVPAAELVRRVGRVRVRLQGLSLPLGPRVLRRVLQHVVGPDVPLDVVSVDELIDRLSGLELTAAGAPGLLDEPTLSALVGGALARSQRARQARDPEFDQRRALRIQYAAVVSAAREARRESSSADGHDRVYDRAYDRLVAADQAAATPLLELHLELEQELERTHFPSMTRAERIALRGEARRRIFGDDVAALLFVRDEAMERYEVDRLALEADTSLSAEDRAGRLAERRDALRVELAKLGTYVSFPDEARPRRQVYGAEPETFADPAEGDAGGRGRP